MNLKEACSIIFPILLQPPKPEDQTHQYWHAYLATLLDEWYPDDVFTGKSEDRGSEAVKVIREVLR